MTTYAVDLFAGARGWDLFEAELGLETVGIEVDADAVGTSSAAGFKTIQADVRDYGPQDFPEATALIGSPPCQTFSTAGKGVGRRALADVYAAAAELVAVGRLDYAKFSDERTGLVLEPLRWVLEAHKAGRPYRWVALEQVPSVLAVWRVMAGYLGELGYSVAVGNLYAEQYGVPQTRRRAFLVARLGGEARLPAPTHSRFYVRTKDRLDPGLRKWVSMSEALGWSGSDMIGFPRIADRNDRITLGGVEYRARDLRSGDEPAFALTEKARSWLRWRNEWLFCPTNVRSHSAIRRTHEPAPTLAFGHERPRWIHAEVADPVRVTTSEAAVLQGFPADYPWQGFKTKQFHQIGNAVPPPLARAVLAEAMGLA